MLYVIHRDGKPWHHRTNNARAYESEGNARQVMNSAITRGINGDMRNARVYSRRDNPVLWDATRETEAARWKIVEYAPLDDKEESA